VLARGDLLLLRDLADGGTVDEHLGLGDRRDDLQDALVTRGFGVEIELHDLRATGRDRHLLLARLEPRCLHLDDVLACFDVLDVDRHGAHVGAVDERARSLRIRQHAHDADAVVRERRDLRCHLGLLIRDHGDRLAPRRRWRLAHLDDVHTLDDVLDHRRRVIGMLVAIDQDLRVGNICIDDDRAVLRFRDLLE
jgi:hypothetical protein